MKRWAACSGRGVLLQFLLQLSNRLVDQLVGQIAGNLFRQDLLRRGNRQLGRGKWHEYPPGLRSK